MIDPDFLIVLGVLAAIAAAGFTVSAFSSSNMTFRPVFVCSSLALVFVFAALQLNPDGYEMAEIPQLFLATARGVLSF
ncbi:MAG: hypothetical protein AAF771_00455 [Pseudomonadota bacterium]